MRGESGRSGAERMQDEIGATAPDRLVALFQPNQLEDGAAQQDPDVHLIRSERIKPDGFEACRNSFSNFAIRDTRLCALPDTVLLTPGVAKTGFLARIRCPGAVSLRDTRTPAIARRRTHCYRRGSQLRPVLRCDTSTPLPNRGAAPLINVRDSACSGFEPFPIIRQVSGAFPGGAPSKELIRDSGGSFHSGGSSYRLPSERLRQVEAVNHSLHHPRDQEIVEAHVPEKCRTHKVGARGLYLLQCCGARCREAFAHLGRAPASDGLVCVLIYNRCNLGASNHEEAGWIQFPSPRLVGIGRQGVPRSDREPMADPVSASTRLTTPRAAEVTRFFEQFKDSIDAVVSSGTRVVTNGGRIQSAGRWSRTSTSTRPAAVWSGSAATTGLACPAPAGGRPPECADAAQRDHPEDDAEHGLALEKEDHRDERAQHKRNGGDPRV
jgi:hypothetical protein